MDPNKIDVYKILLDYFPDIRLFLTDNFIGKI